MDSKYLESIGKLGLQPDFTLEELKKKWRELSKKYHPDKYATLDVDLQKLAEDKLKEINEAYEYLNEHFEENKDNNTMSYDYNKYTNYFTDSKFWEKMKEVAKKVGLKVTSYALILYYVLEKDEVPLKDKIIITGALGYFILPVDLIPDFIPLAGYTDDVAGMLFAIKKCMNYVDDEIKEKVSAKLISWFDIERDYVDNLLKDI